MATVGHVPLCCHFPHLQHSVPKPVDGATDPRQHHSPASHLQWTRSAVCEPFSHSLTNTDSVLVHSRPCSRCCQSSPMKYLPSWGCRCSGDTDNTQRHKHVTQYRVAEQNTRERDGEWWGSLPHTGGWEACLRRGHLI